MTQVDLTCGSKSRVTFHIDKAKDEIAVRRPSSAQRVPDDHGLMIQLHPTGRVSVKPERDRYFPDIHPNCYAPYQLNDVRLLPGGGSGAAVFHGFHSDTGSIVMKHGGSKDTKEVFSLVTVRKELMLRHDKNPEAADWMRHRIPEFVMVYVSPHHVRDRGMEPWASVRYKSKIRQPDRNSISVMARPGNTLLSKLKHNDNVSQLAIGRRSARARAALSMVSDPRQGRRLYIGEADQVLFEVDAQNLCIYVPELEPDGFLGRNEMASLDRLSEELAEHQAVHKWKVTIAQKTIGGHDSENGATVLTSGRLKQGNLLSKLIREFTTVMLNLRELTWPEERGSIGDIQEELATLRDSQDFVLVSKRIDSFVGSAILKNYDPTNGRFAELRKLGELFRRGSLTEEESKPAQYLGLALQRGSPPGLVFIDCQALEYALDRVEDGWLDLIEHAASLPLASATDFIWTCGLTDAGLHNLFLSETRGIELFDLGEPRFTTLPGFLTKFLMSFFHTLGMEEKHCECWVVRFVVQGDKLALTSDTKEKLPYIYETYKYATDHFIRDVFDGDDGVRKLLTKYVVLQLLSDAAFCLLRWEEKGGGVERTRERAKVNMEKWLWRSLWDIYIATHIQESLL